MINSYTKDLFSIDAADLLPGVSVDCVILGFNNGQLRILLSKLKIHHEWMLPGGFVYIDESVDEAAYRLLKLRTGLKNIYLSQFHLFGDQNRVNSERNREILKENGVVEKDNHWFTKRFVSIGYLAFVDFSKVKIKKEKEETLEWFNLNEIPTLYSDHNKIIEKAIEVLKTQIWTLPIGKTLLPEKFTMSELRIIYETILGEKLDRRNFQRKMLSSGLVIQLDELSKKHGIKQTSLFSFNQKEKELL